MNQPAPHIIGKPNAQKINTPKKVGKKIASNPWAGSHVKNARKNNLL
jgi:hypothetical protein